MTLGEGGLYKKKRAQEIRLIMFLVVGLVDLVIARQFDFRPKDKRKNDLCPGLNSVSIT